jgi:hypothetical protein
MISSIYIALSPANIYLSLCYVIFILVMSVRKVSSHPFLFYALLITSVLIDFVFVFVAVGKFHCL